MHYLSPSMGGAAAQLPSGPGLPREPEEPTSLEDAELWLETYDRYLKNVTELAREEGWGAELQPWLDRCVRRRDFWARGRDRLRRLDERKRAV